MTFPAGGTEDQRLRVGLVTPSYAPKIGGVEAHVEQLAHGLSTLGCEVTVFTQADHGDSSGGSTTSEGGVDIRRFADITRSRRFQVAPSLVLSLRRCAPQLDVIHAHSFHGAPALAAAVATSRPFFFTPHYHGVGHTSLARAAHLLYDPVASLIFRRSAAVICVSDAEATLLSHDYPRWGSRITIIPNGVDHDALLAAEAYPVDLPVVLVAGRIEPYKQVDRVVEAMSHLSDRMQLVVVGDGTARADVERLASKTSGGAKISFLGRIETTEVRRWQRTATVAVSLSRHEAFGLVLAEAVAAGAAVIASDIEAHREVASTAGGSVQLVDPDISAVDLGVEIQRMVSIPRNPANESSTLSWSNVAERTLQLYRDVPARGDR